LIISGTIGVCSGMLLAGLHVVVMELKLIGRRLAGSAAPSDVRIRPVLPPGVAISGAPAPEPAAASATRAEAQPPAAAPPWHGEVPARVRGEASEEPEALPPAAAEAPRRRNLLFASSSRKERERAEAKAHESPPPQADAAPEA